LDLDSKISFFGGWLFTTVSSVSLMGLYQAALVGLVGGFFGLLGKEIFYFIKGKINDKVKRQ
jgi:hypothetical protein